MTRHILMIEDNPGDARLMREALHDVSETSVLHVAKDGEEGIDYLRQQGQFGNAPRPHMVVLDLNIPRKPGLELLAEVKSVKDLKTIPVVIFTSSQAPSDIAACYELRANSYVTKPVGLDRYMTAAGEILRYWVAVNTLPNGSADS